MSQNDYVIANQTAPNFRADLNLALQALASNSSGVTAPSTTYANMLWYDTAANTLYMRSEADDAWITLGTLDQSLNTFTPAGIATQTTAVWEAGTDTTESLVSAAKVAAAINALATGPSTSVGEVGTYAFLYNTVGGNLAAGSTKAGSQLRYASVGSINPNSSGTSMSVVTGVTPAGTWQLMGQQVSITFHKFAATWIRIS